MPITTTVFNEIIDSIPKSPTLNLSQLGLTMDDLDRFIEVLRDHPDVTRLDLTGNLLGDGCLKSLVKLNHVRHLILVANKITDSVIHDFIKIPSLTSLSLNLNELSDLAAKPLAALPNLLSLSVTARTLNQIK